MAIVEARNLNALQNSFSLNLCPKTPLSFFASENGRRHPILLRRTESFLDSDAGQTIQLDYGPFQLGFGATIGVTSPGEEYAGNQKWC